MSAADRSSIEFLMSEQNPPGLFGTEPPTATSSVGSQGHLPQTSFSAPVPLGSEPIPLEALERRVTTVTKDWTPPAPRTTPEIIVRGDTLAQVANELNALPEWGRAGGALRTDPISVGTTPSVTVKVRANLVKVLPRWTKFDKASAAAKAEWDRMFAKLTAHEERHMEIAVEEADNLATALMGVEIGEIANLVTTANRTMQTRQDQLDADTNHGARAGVRFGDVTLDVTIL